MKRKLLAMMPLAAVVIAISVAALQPAAGGSDQAGELSGSQIGAYLENLERRVARLEQDVRELKAKIGGVEGVPKPKVPGLGPRAAWRKLEKGMAPPAVRALLGEPLEVKTTLPGQITWRYNRGGAVHFRDRKVTSWYEPRWPKRPKD